MGEIADGLARALRTRDIPISTPARLRFLLKTEKGSTASLARELGVSQRTVQRWLKGTSTPKPAALDRIERRTRSRWQPRVRARQRRAAERDGFTVYTRAEFGFRSSAGSTDDPRQRVITQHLPGQVARDLFAARDAGASEDQQQQIIADGLSHAYFQDNGRRAHGMDVEFRNVDFIEFGV
jgi:transcriptional regulator with XRE-family HTH domain